MSQYDVCDNPIGSARRAFPLVAILQSELADTGHERVVAPLVSRARIPGAVGRLTPIVKVSGTDHVLLVPRMTTISASDLRTRKDNLASHRAEIVTALDYLFLGI